MYVTIWIVLFAVFISGVLVGFTEILSRYTPAAPQESLSELADRKGVKAKSVIWDTNNPLSRKQKSFDTETSARAYLNGLPDVKEEGEI